MMEMACVSLNKVRLHYYVQQGDKRARWLNYLLQHPFRLFGTTLIGVNLSMVIGSECSREFHSALGLSPDLAPLTQVFLVVIFGELAPMFAARNYAENVSMLGVPIVYASAKILTPALWIIGRITRLVNFLTTGKTTHNEFFLSLEELEKILEEHSDTPPSSDTQELNVITKNIFQLRHKTAEDILTPLSNFLRLPSNATVLQMKNLIKRTDGDFVAIYYRNYSNIVGIAFPRDLVRASDTCRIRDYARPLWFVTQKTKLTQILQQFQKNQKRLAIILDGKGKNIGIITLDDLLEEIFGESRFRETAEKSSFVMERTFPGEHLVGDFNKEFNVVLDPENTLTLSQLMAKKLKHHPEKGDSVYIEPFELTAKETTLLEAKTIIVKTKKK